MSNYTNKASPMEAGTLHRYPKRFKLLLFLLPISLLLSIVFAVSIGSVSVKFSTVWKIIWMHAGAGHLHLNEGFKALDNIIWQIRLPRVLLGVFVGAGLSLAGTGIQAMVRNPLAEPYILGISSGASVGATLVILWGGLGMLEQFALPVAAFLGALFTMVLVFFLAQVAHRISTMRLLLSGIALSLIFMAVTNLIVILSPDEDRIHSALFWMMGSLTSAVWHNIPIAAITVIGCFVYLWTHWQSLNLLLMGEETALTLGLNIDTFRKILVVVVSLLTGILVSVSGAIGFIGLMIPHLTRLLVGPDHRKVLVISFFMGAVFMVWADVAARVILAPEEIPIGIITALLGGPFFIWLLRKNTYSFGSS